MSRRRRSEPAFGSDSFLDVVSNLVGIVLIIIVMVGAHIRELPDLAPIEKAKAAPRADLEPTRAEIDAYAGDVAELQRRLLATLRDVDAAEKDRAALFERQEQARAARSQAALHRTEQENRLAERKKALAQVQSSAPQLRQRLHELRNAVTTVEQKPPERRLIRFHLPVSRPVDAEELLFECHDGRVTFADVRSLLEQAQQEMPDKAQELRSRWSITSTVGPVGAFQMRYVLERERTGSFTGLTSRPGDLADLPPAEDRQFRYGIGRWELIPVWPERGDTVADAVKEGSRLRAIIDALDPEQTVLTFFVYPDSFDLFRELRDYLHERGFVVAGRPLPPGHPIFGSKNGSLSRGQ